MNTILDSGLPDALLVYKSNIEATIKAYIEIKAKPEINLSLWQSKFGGLPYVPKDFQYPTDSNGQAMLLLAQINFAETPKLESFPEKGILQFYISDANELFGICFEDLRKQNDFRVLYFPDVYKDESKLVTDFSFLHKPDMQPLQQPCSVTFNLKYAPMPAVDYQFESNIIGRNSPKSEDEIYRIMDVYAKLFKSTGHKIGGYPFFTQFDPRENKKYKGDGYTLLFQMDTDVRANIMWGDSGVGNFFIREQDLRNLDFSKVLYSWDCC
jgi:uncharacterized protein YwqG